VLAGRLLLRPDQRRGLKPVHGRRLDVHEHEIKRLVVWSKYSKLFLWHSFTPQPRRPALARLSRQSHPLLICRHT
jgi:hypothetical protein